MKIDADAPGLTLRQAALIVGSAYLLNPVSYAEFVLWPKLMAGGDVERTMRTSRRITAPSSASSLRFS